MQVKLSASHVRIVQVSYNMLMQMCNKITAQTTQAGEIITHTLSALAAANKLSHEDTDKMKTVTYMGQTFSVPDEARYIAADSNNAVYVYEYRPVPISNVHYSNYLNPTGARQWFVGDLDKTLHPCEAC